MKSKKFKNRLKACHYLAMSGICLALSVTSTGLAVSYAFQDDTTQETTQETTDNSVSTLTGVSKEDAIKQVLGENLNEHRKIESQEDIEPSADIIRQGQQSDPQAVRMLFTNLVGNTSESMYEISLDESRNIIFIKNLSDSVFREGANIHDMFRLSMTFDVKFTSHTDHGFKSETITEENGYQLEGTHIRGGSGYNGYVEFIIASTPVIFYNDPSLEPHLSPEEQIKVDEIMNGTSSNTPPISGSVGGEGSTDTNVPPTPPTDNTTTDTPSVEDPGLLPPPDYVYPEYPEYEEDVINPDYLLPQEPQIDSTYGDDYGPGVFEDDSITSGNSSNVNQDVVVDYDSSVSTSTGGSTSTDDFWNEDTTVNPDYVINSNSPSNSPSRPTGELPAPNKGYKPVWGTTETGDHLKENISDGSVVLERVYGRPVLNVVDIKGNLVDLEKKTEETKPAEFERQEPIMVGEAKESKDVVPMVLALYGLSLASFLGFMFSLHKYYEESLKEIQLQELSEEDTTIIENSNFDELLETNASSATLIHSSLDK